SLDRPAAVRGQNRSANAVCPSRGGDPVAAGRPAGLPAGGGRRVPSYGRQAARESLPPHGGGAGRPGTAGRGAPGRAAAGGGGAGGGAAGAGAAGVFVGVRAAWALTRPGPPGSRAPTGGETGSIAAATAPAPAPAADRPKAPDIDMVKVAAGVFRMGSDDD